MGDGGLQLSDHMGGLGGGISGNPVIGPSVFIHVLDKRTSMSRLEIPAIDDGYRMTRLEIPDIDVACSADAVRQAPTPL